MRVPWRRREQSDDRELEFLAGMNVHDSLVGLLQHHRHDLPVEDTDSVAQPLPPMPEGYVFQEVIRRGGQGLVVKALQQSTQRPVALKIITEQGASPQAVKRMELEFEIIRMLEHPNIVRLYDSGQVAGARFLAMEFIDGRHLDVWMEDEEPPLRRRVELFRKLCRAVHFAHQRGVIHRDLKPSNILIDGAGDPHILDFGVAKPAFHATRSRELTQTGEFAGTLPYASPEQLADDPSLVDVRTDVHALGLLLYESFAGQRAWQGAASIAGLVRAITHTDPEPVVRINPQVGRDLDAIIMCALQKEPDRRFQSAEALGRDLDRWLAGVAVEARGDGRWYLLRKTLTRHRWAVGMIALILTVLTIAATVSWSFWRQEQQEADRAQRAERELTQALDDVLQLSDTVKLRRLLASHQGLWPVGPRLVDSCREWLRDARSLARNEGVHARSLRRLRIRALPYSSAERRLGYPNEVRRMEELEASLRTSDVSDERRASWSEERERLALVTDLRLHWSYADERDQFFEEQLEELIDLYVQLDDAMASVTDRLRRSRTYRTRSLLNAREAWDRCLRDLSRGGAFTEVSLRPVPGLVPLGRDERSGLWNFWHVESGAAPRWDEGQRRWRPGLAGGIILVLLPPASFHMGASPPAEGADEEHNVDRFAEVDVGPVHQVRLSAFFISKYELTENQWRRFLARERDGSEAGELAENIPAGYVSWEEVSRVARALGLEVPTEAQWEHAARGGSRAVFPTGSSVTSLRGFANILDEGSFSGRRLTSIPTAGLDDGRADLAVVGSYAPNGFGLHDVIGNVSEWCRDGMAGYTCSVRPRDGLRASGQSPVRVHRGGSFALAAPFCTSAARHYAAPEERVRSLGVRLSLTYPHE